MAIAVTGYDKLTRRVLVEKNNFKYKKFFYHGSEEQFKKAVIFLEQMGGFIRFFSGKTCDANNYKQQHIRTANKLIMNFKEGKAISYKETSFDKHLLAIK
jgi:hypothetical protein